MTCRNCEQLVKALERMCRNSLTEDDMLALDWSSFEMEEACAAYEKALELIAKTRREPPPIFK